MDNEKYYESFDWSSFKDSSSNFKIIAKLIPQDVNSIIDIGCGNGLITNELAKKYQVVGVDRSKSALEFVKGEKIAASCDSVPVEDQSFDLVLSSELLEHLDSPTFDKTVKELKRISKKYILIGVPNQESLNKGNIQCPKCKTIFHRCYHQQSFSIAKFEKLFPEYKVVDTKTCGINVRVYKDSIANIKQKLTPAKAWIPYYWAKKGERNAHCPKCDTAFEYEFKFNPIAFAMDSLNVLLTKKIPFHMVVLLEKK